MSEGKEVGFVKAIHNWLDEMGKQWLEIYKPKRARTKKGKYVKDNPKTKTNEAWVGGKKPKKPIKKKS